jgi:phospholipid/cholesterol/gamma-HCH transport system substrate-binding protein
MTKETKVGIFFVLGLILLAIFTFKVEDLGKLFRRRYTVYTSFKHASGLEVGDPVAVIGVKVGAITDLTLKDNRVTVEMELQGNIHIYPGAQANVEWAGLLGRKYVDITMGDTTQKPLDNGTLIQGIDSPTVGDVMGRIDKVAGSVEGLMGGDTMQSLKELGPKITRVLDNAATISDDLAQGKGTIGQLMASDDMYKKLNAIADQLQATSVQLNDMVAKANSQIGPILDDVKAATPQLKDTVASINKFVDDFNKGEGTLPMLVKDPEVYNSLKQTVANLQGFSDKLNNTEGGVGALVQDPQFTADLRTAAADLRQLADKLNSGQGTIPQLINNDDLYRDIRKLVTDAQEAVRAIQEQIPVSTFAGFLFNNL